MRTIPSIVASSLLLFSTMSSASIEWQVVDPFRLIDYEKSTNRFEIPSNQSALDFVTYRLASRSQSDLPPIHNIRSYAKNEYFFPTHQTVSAKLASPIPGRCIWTYQSYTKESDCSEEFTFEAITQFGRGDSRLTVKHESQEIDGAHVVVRDRLVLGLGDSFASGEGNPDIPAIASEAALKYMAENNREIHSTGRWMNHTELWLKTPAEWLEKQCHRSFLSQHILAALRLAKMNSKESLTVLPLSCSGAEVLDGVLVPQQSPPGGGKYVAESQLNTAVKKLCRNGDVLARREYFYRGYTGSRNMKKIEAYVNRCQGELRVPDAVLLSVGGNDVGFAPAIAWATIPSNGRHILGSGAVNITNRVMDPVCPKETGQRICKKNEPTGRDRIKYWLPKYYEYLQREFEESGLVKDPKTVYLTAYPNPVFIEDGKTLCGKDRSADVVEQARSRLYTPMHPGVWEMQITKEEISDLQKGLILPLYTEMKDMAEKYQWNFVDGYIEEIQPHGVCAGFARKDSYKNSKGHLRDVPVYPHIMNGKWYPIEPWKEWAYDPNRARWFRNTNDSVLFQNDNSDSVMNGAFHPDYRAHALMADYLADRISADWQSLNTLSGSK